MNRHFSNKKRIERKVVTANGLMRQLFIGPFYRQHAGTFLFLYVLFLGSFLFINYLGEIPASESFFWHFVLMIFMVTDQFMVMLFLGLSIFYLIKTRLFIKDLISQDAYVFLKESLATMPAKKQWWSWFKVEFLLSLPLFIYALACLLMSLFNGQPIFGIVIIVFLLAGTVLVTSLHCRQLMTLPPASKGRGRIFRKSRWNLTKWSVLIYSATLQLPALIITKTATILITYLMIHWEAEEKMSSRAWWLSFLLIGASHALLAFRSARFMEEKLSDIRGLPLNEWQGFLFSIARSYLLLLLPECLILLFAGYGQMALIGLVSEFCILFFYHYFAAYLAFNLKSMLKTGFLLLCVAFVLILYGFYWLVVLLHILTAYGLYRSRYYCRS